MADAHHFLFIREVLKKKKKLYPKVAQKLSYHIVSRIAGGSIPWAMDRQQADACQQLGHASKQSPIRGMQAAHETKLLPVYGKASLQKEVPVAQKVGGGALLYRVLGNFQIHHPTGAAQKPHIQESKLELRNPSTRTKYSKNWH